MRLYPILAPLLGPFAILGLLWLGRREPAWREHLPQRRGWSPQREDRPLWVHAASVGEVQSALGLVRQLQHTAPERPLLLSAFTPTGAQAWQRANIPGAQVMAWPLDQASWVARSLDRVRPRLLLIVETEIWPQMLMAAHQRGIPVAFVSARVRQTSVAGWRRWVGQSRMQRCLGPVALMATQSAADAKRFAQLGASQVAALGSLKWDIPAPKLDPEWRQHIVDSVQSRPAWLAASTHPGEEAQVFAAHAALRQRWPDALLIIAPRHPRRSAEVVDLARAAGLDVVTRSSRQNPIGAAVWLIDTLGELQALFASIPVAFMGGSLVPIGGHNLLEPAQMGCAIMTGPHWQNAAEVAQALLADQALTEVEDAQQLSAAVSACWAQPEQTRAQGERARAVQQAGAGAQARIFQALSPLLEAADTNSVV